MKGKGEQEMDKGRQGLRLGCTLQQDRLIPHTPEGKEKKAPNQAATSKPATLMTVSRGSKKHCVSTYCIHSPLGFWKSVSVLEHVREENGGQERWCHSAGVTQCWHRGHLAAGPSSSAPLGETLSTAAGTPWPVRGLCQG